MPPPCRAHRSTVLQGNYVEERAVAGLPSVKPLFTGVSEAHERYGAQVCINLLRPFDVLESLYFTAMYLLCVSGRVPEVIDRYCSIGCHTIVSKFVTAAKVVWK
jgi:hypothetical protein